MKGWKEWGKVNKPWIIHVTILLRNNELMLDPSWHQDLHSHAVGDTIQLNNCKLRGVTGRNDKSELSVLIIDNVPPALIKFAGAGTRGLDKFQWVIIAPSEFMSIISMCANCFGIFIRQWTRTTRQKL